MKRLLGFLVVLIVVLIAAALILPFLIPADVYRDQIEAQVKQQTGRDLDIAGDMSLSFLPPVSVTMENVTFKNAEGGQAENMLSVKKIDVNLALLPLLMNREVRINSFVLEEPVIALEVLKNGKPNWQFAAQAAQAADQAQDQTSDQTPDASGEQSGGSQVSEISFGDVRLSSGRISYTDLSTGEAQILENINLTLSLPSLDEAFGADGRLDYKGETITMDIKLVNPRAFMDGTATDLSAKLGGNLFDMGFQGTAAMGEGKVLPVTANGPMSLTIPSVRKLAAWQGATLPPGEGYERFAISGNAAAANDRITFSGAELTFDEISGAGQFALALAGPRPKVTGDFAVDTLDIRPYQGGAGSSGGGGSGGGGSEWSREPIDFSGLRAVDANLVFGADRVLTDTIKMGKSQLKITLENGLLVSDLKELSLYEGGGQIYLEVNARGGTPVIRNRTKFSLIQALPLLQDLVGAGVLEGVGNLEYDVTTRGRSQYDFMQAMNGDGRIVFNDGAIFGINVAQIMRNPVEAAMSLTGRDGGQKTDFAELSASFSIRNGVLTNPDFKLLNPLLRMPGNGTTSLVNRTVDFRFKPTGVSSLEGQGGETGLEGITVPLRVTGTWSNLKIAPDLESMAKDEIRDRLFGGDEKKDKKDKKDKKKRDPRDLLDRVLGD